MHLCLCCEKYLLRGCARYLWRWLGRRGCSLIVCGYDLRKCWNCKDRLGAQFLRATNLAAAGAKRLYQEERMIESAREEFKTREKDLQEENDQLRRRLNMAKHAVGELISTLVNSSHNGQPLSQKASPPPFSFLQLPAQLLPLASMLPLAPSLSFRSPVAPPLPLPLPLRRRRFHLVIFLTPFNRSLSTLSSFFHCIRASLSSLYLPSRSFSLRFRSSICGSVRGRAGRGCLEWWLDLRVILRRRR